MRLQKAYYEKAFETSFLRAKGNAFQTFFETLMQYAHGGDFIACRPWGIQGDKKNDGFLKSERRLFQVYAPNELTEAIAIKKISEDFSGAKKHWKKLFDKWTFVHNSVDGLPPHVINLLLQYEADNEGLSLDHWCFNEMREIFRLLSLDKMESWFGAAPTEETKAQLGFKELAVVLEKISGSARPSSDSVKAVPMGKIEANALSEDVTSLLTHGMAKTPLLQGFFETWHDPGYGERLAQAFREKYLELKDGLPPNRIFDELHVWAGGNMKGSAAHEMAVLTVLAYYFERCDIFEAPLEATQ